MNVRLATSSDLDVLDEIYETARQFMKTHGNPNQWYDGHPNRKELQDEINQNHFYVIEIDNIIQASFVYFDHPDPTYTYIEGQWLNDHEYSVIHKVATRNLRRGMGKEIIEFVKQKQKDIRIDTHEDNIYMQKLLEQNGFVKTGIIYLENKEPRWAYQYVSNQD